MIASIFIKAVVHIARKRKSCCDMLIGLCMHFIFYRHQNLLIKQMDATTQ
uniref:Uncharacterized protein n=1 Tax=Arundo donax TaxID=35708 RepID=A0A0A9CMD2_ARUDO